MFRCLLFLCLVVTASSGSPRGSPRILGGADADIEDYPFAASINWSGLGLLCSAVIVNAEWVLTNSGCTVNPDVRQYTVRVGSALASNESFIPDTGSLHNVTKWIFHPLSDEAIREFDFALVKVNPPFEFSATVAAVALPEFGQESPDGAVGEIAGWGQKDDEVFGSVEKLQYANVSLVSDANCATILGADYNERVLCARGENGDVALCWHDEGGPLVIDGVLFGIALWPDVCASPLEVQLFGRVASVQDWIITTIGAGKIIA